MDLRVLVVDFFYIDFVVVVVVDCICVCLYLQCWENGIILCRELADQYESYYDYRNLSKMRVSRSKRKLRASWINIPFLNKRKCLTNYPVSSR